jgi:hypothetical protein
MVEVINVIEPIVRAAFTAGIYGGGAYLAGRLDKPGEPFQKKKFYGTLAVGGAVGLGCYALGIPITEASILGIFATIGGLEVGQKIIEAALGFLKRIGIT